MIMSRFIVPDIFPAIVCLCGSTRFYREFILANFQKTMVGEIVLSIGFYPHVTAEQWGRQAHGEDVGITTEQKEQLDELHKRKIDLCDYIYVLNKNNYIGDSTRSEINYAMGIGKPIIYLEPFEEEKFEMIVWPDGTAVSREDFKEEEWSFKSDDYEIQWWTEEEESKWNAGP